MTMLVVIYGGPRPELVPQVFDSHGVTGWTELAGGHGAGRTGRHEETRAWPGRSRVFFSVAEDAAVPAVTAALRERAAAAVAGERLHVAELPVERFF